MSIAARLNVAKPPGFLPGIFRFLGARLPVVGIVLGLIAFTAIAAEAYFSINSLERRTQWVKHTYQVLEILESTFSTAKDTQTTARNFAFSGAPSDLAAFEESADDLKQTLRWLRAMSADSKIQLRNIDVLESRIAAHLASLEETTRIRQETGQASAAVGFAAGNRVRDSMEGVRLQIRAMEGFEKKLLRERSNAVERIAQHTKLWILFGTAGAYFLLLSAVHFLSREMRQREKAEAALLRANEDLTRHAGQLETANKELDSFSYSISHDLRIPLRAVSGYARMVEEDYADRLGEEGRRFLKVIRDNSKRMSDLIDDLLNFSRLGRKKIAAGEVDMNELVAAVVNDIQSKENFPAAQIDVDQLPAAWGDRTLLYQVWVNLISNALKYSAKSERPAIRVTGSDEGAEQVYSVSDNGVGFDMQYYDKLFGVFQRLHSQDEFPGTGVGLAIVQRIVSRHGGRAWAEGRPGEGATFFFSIPSKGRVNG